MSLTCRYYRNSLPTSDQFVTVEVKAIGDVGIDVVLLEFNDQEGMILLSELTRLRMRSIHKLVRVGRREVAMVLRVDPTKRYVDLSRRRVLKEDLDEANERFARGRTVNNILRQTAKNLGLKTNEEFEELYEKTAWFYDEKFDRDGAAFDVFVRAAKDEKVLNDCPVDEKTRKLILEDVRRRFTLSAVKCRAMVAVRCYTSDGIDAIKDAIRSGLTVSTAENPIEIRLIASPLFVVNVACAKPQIGLSLLEEVLQRIQTTIEENRGVFEVKHEPHVVTDADEGKIVKMLRDAEDETNQIPGDDESFSSEDSEDSEDEIEE